MSCCSTVILLITLAFSGGFAAMIGIGATNDSISRDTAKALVTSGSVCLVWSLVYLGLALGYSIYGSTELDHWLSRNFNLKSDQSCGTVGVLICFGIASFIGSIIIIAVGASKSNSGLWAAGLANLVYTIVTGGLFLFITCCCCALGYAMGK